MGISLVNMKCITVILLPASLDQIYDIISIIPNNRIQVVNCSPKLSKNLSFKKAFSEIITEYYLDIAACKVTRGKYSVEISSVEILSSVLPLNPYR